VCVCGGGGGGGPPPPPIGLWGGAGGAPPHHHPHPPPPPPPPPFSTILGVKKIACRSQAPPDPISHVIRRLGGSQRGTARPFSQVRISPPPPSRARGHALTFFENGLQGGGGDRQGAFQAHPRKVGLEMLPPEDRGRHCEFQAHGRKGGLSSALG
jgi:hypothetical protein